MKKLLAILALTLAPASAAATWQEAFKSYEIKSSKVCDAVKWKFANDSYDEKVVDVRSYSLKTSINLAIHMMSGLVAEKVTLPKGVTGNNTTKGIYWVDGFLPTFPEIYYDGYFAPYYDSTRIILFFDAVDKYTTELCIIETFSYGRDNPARKK